MQAQGPKDCHMTNFQNFQGLQHRFKLDIGACSNLLPLRLYKELFPHVTRQEMLRSIDQSAIVFLQEERNTSVWCVLSTCEKSESCKVVQVLCC